LCTNKQKQQDYIAESIPCSQEHTKCTRTTLHNTILIALLAVEKIWSGIVFFLSAVFLFFCGVEQKKETMGSADWESIQQVVQRLGHRIPIIANGNLASYQDVVQCLEFTGVDSVMSSEAILEYPPVVFQPSPLEDRSLRPGPGQLQIVYDYLDLWSCWMPMTPRRKTEANASESLFARMSWASRRSQL
jgi:hypothetical protein